MSCFDRCFVCLLCVVCILLSSLVSGIWMSATPCFKLLTLLQTKREGVLHLNDTRKLDISERESLLRVGSIECLISIWSDLQLEGFGSRDHDVGIQESVSTEPVFSRSDSVSRSLIDSHKVIRGTEATDCTSQFGHVTLEWSTKHEGVRCISFPFDGTEVLLHSNTSSVPQVGQVSWSTLDPGSIVEGLDDRRGWSVVLHATRRCCITFLGVLSDFV